MTSKKILAAELAILLGAFATAMAQAQHDAAANPAPAASATSQQLTAEATPPEPTPKDATTPPKSSSSGARLSAADELSMRLEGEKRFRANCGRCHVAPPKFPPRAMATILRHMRVRATITDQDQKLILHYMTE